MKFALGFLIALCAVSAISASCGCLQCSRRNLQVVPSQNPNIDIIYKGQPCPCQRALPYEVQIPIESAPEPRQSYEYQVIAPPRPAPPAQRYIYNYQLQVPVEKQPDLRLSGLVTRLDRVVLPAPDCTSVNPAVATDSNAALYSDGNELTPVLGGYTSGSVYSNGAYNTPFIGSSGIGTYNPISNTLNSNYGSSVLYSNGGSISLSPYNEVRGPIVERLTYYPNSELSSENDDCYRYAPAISNINIVESGRNSGESSESNNDINSSEFIEANVPYIPDVENIDNLGIKNSEYGILMEVPQSERRVRTPVDNDDYSNNESEENNNQNFGDYLTSQNINLKYDSDEDSDEDANDYSSDIFSTINTDDMNNYVNRITGQNNFHPAIGSQSLDYDNFDEAIEIDQTYAPNNNNQQLDTELLYQLYLEYLNSQNANQQNDAPVNSRRKRDISGVETTTETNLRDLWTFLNNRDCSVPYSNKNIEQNINLDEQKDFSTTENSQNNEILTTTKSYSNILNKTETGVENQTEKPTFNIKNEQLTYLAKLFKKYNEMKLNQNNKTPVSIEKFLFQYPVAAKILNDLEKQKVSHTSSNLNSLHAPETKKYFEKFNSKIPFTKKSYLPKHLVESNQIPVKTNFDSTDYFKPPLCPTITNLLKHPRYNQEEIGNAGILQYVPELVPNSAMSVTEKLPSKKDLIQERILAINGINIGNTRKARSYAVQPSLNTFNKPYISDNEIRKTSNNPFRPFSNLNPKMSVAPYSVISAKNTLDTYSKFSPVSNNIADKNVNLQNRGHQVPEEYILSKIPTNLPTGDSSFEADTSFDTGLYNTKTEGEESSTMLSKMSKMPSEDTTSLYKAIDLKQKLHDMKKQESDDDSELYKKYFQIPSIQQKANKYSRYFRIPQFERLPVNEKFPLNLVEKSTPEILVPKKSTDREQPFQPFFLKSDTAQKFKRHNVPQKTNINQVYDHGLGENFSNSELKQVITLQNSNLLNFESGEQKSEVDVSSEHNADANERYERTLRCILCKLKNARLLNYVRRRYNEKLARKLGVVAKTFETFNSLNALASGCGGNSGVQKNCGVQYGTNTFANQYASNLVHQNNFITTNFLKKSEPKIVYDHLGHKYVEVNGFRRLIKPNIKFDRQFEVKKTVEFERRPCAKPIDIVAGTSQTITSTCNNNCQNNLDSEIIVETNDIFNKEPIYKTETIEIVKPEKHIYFPEEKYIIQKTNIEEQAPQRITLETQSTNTCNKHSSICQTEQNEGINIIQNVIQEEPKCQSTEIHSSGCGIFGKLHKKIPNRFKLVKEVTKNSQRKYSKGYQVIDEAIEERLRPRHQNIQVIGQVIEERPRRDQNIEIIQQISSEQPQQNFEIIENTIQEQQPQISEDIQVIGNQAQSIQQQNIKIVEESLPQKPDITIIEEIIQEQPKQQNIEIIESIENENLWPQQQSVNVIEQVIEQQPRKNIEIIEKIIQEEPQPQPQSVRIIENIIQEQPRPNIEVIEEIIQTEPQPQQQSVSIIENVIQEQPRQNVEIVEKIIRKEPCPQEQRVNIIEKVIQEQPRNNIEVVEKIIQREPRPQQQSVNIIEKVIQEPRQEQQNYEVIQEIIHDQPRQQQNIEIIEAEIQNQQQRGWNDIDLIQNVIQEPQQTQNIEIVQNIVEDRPSKSLQEVEIFDNNSFEESPSIFDSTEIVQTNQQNFVTQPQEIIFSPRLEPTNSLESANVEIKETIKKYQIPCTQTIQSNCIRGTGDAIQKIRQEIDIIDKSQNQESSNYQNEQISSIKTHQHQHQHHHQHQQNHQLQNYQNHYSYGKNELTDYQKLAQIQQYLNFLQFLQNSPQNIGINQNQQLIQNAITSTNQNLNNLLSQQQVSHNNLNFLSPNTLPTTNPLANILSNYQTSHSYLNDVGLNNNIKTLNNVHSYHHNNHQNSHLSSQLNLQNIQNNNIASISKNRAFEHSAQINSQKDLTFNNLLNFPHQKPIYYSQPSVTSPLINNAGNPHSNIVNLVTASAENNNFNLQKQLNSNFNQNQQIHSFNKRNADDTNNFPVEKNCNINPDHMTSDITDLNVSDN